MTMGVFVFTKVGVAVKGKSTGVAIASIEDVLQAVMKTLKNSKKLIDRYKN
jgi:hypothetical protein